MRTIALHLNRVEDLLLAFSWEKEEDATSKLFWSDRYSETMTYKCVYEGDGNQYTLQKATHVPHYVKVELWKQGEKIAESSPLKTPVKKVWKEQLEKLGRGLIAIKTEDGVFLGWRMYLWEATGYTQTGMSGTDYVVYKNGQKLALITDSTNYLDRTGTLEDVYAVAALSSGAEGNPQEEQACQPVVVHPQAYIELPLQVPEGGVTPAGEVYTYSANDMSVGDVDGDGEYEFFVKWDPSNSHDVSIKGYTGNCLLDCYKLSGRLLWRLDMGVNIRAGF